MMKDGLRTDTIVLDPPRKGCEEPLIDAVAQSGAERIVYVSCNPATLARDCAKFVEAGYKVGKVQPVDMFPGEMLLYFYGIAFLGKEYMNENGMKI